MAAKRTSELIQMCRGLALTSIDVGFSENAIPDASVCVGIKALTTARCLGLLQTQPKKA